MFRESTLLEAEKFLEPDTILLGLRHSMKIKSGCSSVISCFCCFAPDQPHSLADSTGSIETKQISGVHATENLVYVFDTAIHHVSM